MDPDQTASTNVGQNIPGQNIPCHFLHPGQNIPHQFADPDKTSHAVFVTPDKTSHAILAAPDKTSQAISATPDTLFFIASLNVCDSITVYSVNFREGFISRNFADAEFRENKTPRNGENSLSFTTYVNHAKFANFKEANMSFLTLFVEIKGSRKFPNFTEVCCRLPSKCSKYETSANFQRKSPFVIFVRHNSNNQLSYRD